MTALDSDAPPVVGTTIKIRFLAARSRGSGEEAILSRLLDDKNTRADDVKSFGTAQPLVIGFAQGKTIAKHGQAELISWQAQIHCRENSRKRSIPIVADSSKHVHWSAHLIPGKALLGREFPEQPCSDQADERGERSAVRPRPQVGCRQLTVVLLPRSGGSIFIGQQPLQQSPSKPCIGVFPIGNLRQMSGQVFGDNLRAMVELREDELEVFPALMFVRLFDQAMFGFGEILKYERKRSEIRAGRKVQLLNRLLLHPGQLVEAVELAIDIFVTQRELHE